MSSFVVSCTYGNTQPHAIYASGIKRREDAEALCERAISLGYDDAEVLSAAEYKGLFAGPRSKAYSGRPARARRAV